MSNGGDILDDVILTEEGALTPEEYAIREQAGTAAPEVSQEALLTRASKEAREELFDSPVQTFFERAASAATFGVTDVLRSEESALEAGYRAEVSPTAATLGTVTGAVAPGLLSGGAGTAGTLARLTPAGRLSAATGRLAARGGLVRPIAAGALEGMAGAAGDYMSRTALDEDAEFSAEALIAHTVKGGALGAGVSGAGVVLGKGLSKLATKTSGSPRLGAMGQEIEAVASPPTSLIAGKAAPRKWTRYKSVVRRKLADESAEPLRAMGQRIEDMAVSAPVQKLDDLATTDAVRAARVQDAELDGLITQAREVATELDAVAKDTRSWFGDYGRAVGLDTAVKKITKDAPDALEDTGVLLIARTDELSSRYNRLSSEIEARLGLQGAPGSPLAVAADGAPPVPASGLGRVAAAAGKAKEIGASGLGALELAGAAGVDTGMPSASDIPLIGDVMGYYLKYKGLRAAARGVGVIPMTAVTRAAGVVKAADDTIAQRVGRVLTGAVKRAGSSAAPALVPAQVVSRMRDIQSITPADAGANAALELEGTTQGVAMAAAQTASRAVQYLQDNAPRDPIAHRMAFMPPWQPSNQELRDFARRADAVEDPEGAIERALTNPMSAIEVDVLQSVYPGMYERTRQELLDGADQLAQQMTTAELTSIARAFGLPLTVETSSPMYGTVIPASERPQPQTQFARPSTPGASPSVNLEDTARRPR